MKREELELYFINEDCEPYHNYIHLDAMRHMLLNKDLPLPLKNYVQEQYHSSIINLGVCRIDSFSDKLFKHLNGSEAPIIMEDLNQFEYTDSRKNLTQLVSTRIKIPYFERLNYYFLSIGHMVKLQTEYVVLDIRSNGVSLLNEAIKRQMQKDKSGRNSMTNGHYSLDMPWVMSGTHYMLTTTGAFYKPYNGIGAESIPGIAGTLGRSSYRDADQEIITYINKQVDGLAYYVGDEIARKHKVLTKYEHDRIEKELAKVAKDLWDN